jgi:dTDP-glucose 4,6-dehydratase
MTRELPRADLDHVLAHAGEAFESLRGERVLITGGTGFVGIWLVESLAFASRALGLGARALVLTRDPQAFRAKAPHLAADPAVELLEGEVGSVRFPPGDLRGVIHAAAVYGQRAGDRLSRFEADALGARRTLELARERGARYLLASSGAVYGPQPPGLARLEEEHPGAPLSTDPDVGYAHGKRHAELLCALHAREHRVEATIARGFAFVGPWLPLDGNFAIGNFLRDALAGGPIRIDGDGTPRRSYLHAADLAVWLWTIWARGLPGRAYNVGSEHDLSIGELAAEVAAALAPSAEVQIARTPTGVPAARYVPSTRRAREELGLRERIGLRDAIVRTAEWFRRGA